MLSQRIISDKAFGRHSTKQKLFGSLHTMGFPCYGYSIRQDTAGYSRIRQDTAGYGRIRQDTAGYGRIRQDTAGYGRIRQDAQHTAGYGRIRQDTADTAGYCRIRQDTAGYDRVQNICLFALRKQPFCVHSVFGGISYRSCMYIVTFPADNLLHVHHLIRFKKEEDCYLLLELGGISSCSCLPIVPFLFRLTTRLAAHQFSVLKKKMIAT